jgi:hypothetical protein
MVHYKVYYNFNGSQRWYQNGKYHREDEPAVLYPGDEKI